VEKTDFDCDFDLDFDGEARKDKRYLVTKGVAVSMW